MYVSLCMVALAGLAPAPVSAADQEPMTVDEATRLGEEFGVIVGDVDEDIKKELKLERAQGVAVFEVIGSSRADYAGIKVRSIIKEIDKTEIENFVKERGMPGYCPTQDRERPRLAACALAADRE